MKRSMIAVLALLTVGGALALTIGCSKKTPTGVTPQPVSIESKAAFAHGGVTVHRIPDDPSKFAARYRMFAVLDADGHSTRLLTYEEASRTLSDDDRVSPVVVWKIVTGRSFDPAAGVSGEPPRSLAASQPVVIEGGGDPPDPGCGGCWCCVSNGSSCSCSWGCIKDCYRTEEIPE
jgi:hypothetical protein